MVLKILYLWSDRSSVTILLVYNLLRLFSVTYSFVSSSSEVPLTIFSKEKNICKLGTQITSVFFALQGPIPYLDECTWRQHWCWNCVRIEQEGTGENGKCQCKWRCGKAIQRNCYGYSRVKQNVRFCACKCPGRYNMFQLCHSSHLQATGQPLWPTKGVCTELDKINLPNMKHFCRLVFQRRCTMTPKYKRRFRVPSLGSPQNSGTLFREPHFVMYSWGFVI